MESTEPRQPRAAIHSASIARFLGRFAMLGGLWVALTLQGVSAPTRVNSPVSAAGGEYRDGQEEGSGRPRSPLCRSGYKAEVVKVELHQQKLGDFVRHLNETYQANIALDPDLHGLEIRMYQVSGRWTTLLKVIMAQENLRKDCYDGVASIKRANRS